MLRAQRIRIVLGISTFLGGLAIAVLGPVVVVLLHSPGFSLADSGDNLGEQIAAMGQIRNLALMVQLSGVGLAAAGFLLTFIQWAMWFIGPRDA
jgi:hypothetical protein